jgi:4-methyl-5(b-hydroxyethyl)-thiazole monophosphate biosynthesis
VLCLLADGFEEIEAVTPVDVLRRAGVKVVIASLGGQIVTGRGGIRLEPDASLGEVDYDKFDLLLIPGGPGVQELRTDGRAAELAKDFYMRGKAVAAICAAPLILQDAGLLDGRRFTAHYSARGELPDALDERVVSDGELLTSRGAGTALDFAFALVAHLAGLTKVEEVHEAMMA